MTSDHVPPETGIPKEPAESGPTAEAVGDVHHTSAGAADLPGEAPTSSTPGPSSAWRTVARLFRMRLSATNLLVALLCALLGFAVVVQIRQTRDESLSTLRQSDLVRLLDEVTQRSSELEESAADLRIARNELLTGSKDNAAALEIATQRAKTQGILSGRLPAQGPGVTMEIIPGESEIRPNTLFTILEELRNAGAEAVEVNGIRIVASSHFVDSAQGTVLDGQVLAAPYRWIAIGNPDTLAPALEIPGGAMASVRTVGGTGTIENHESVEINAIREPTDAQFATPIPPEDAS